MKVKITEHAQKDGLSRFWIDDAQKEVYLLSKMYDGTFQTSSVEKPAGWWRSRASDPEFAVEGLRPLLNFTMEVSE